MEATALRAPFASTFFGDSARPVNRIRVPRRAGNSPLVRAIDRT